MNNKVYIAGKITGDPDYRAKFAEASREVVEYTFFDRHGVEAAQAGWFNFEPVSPAAILPTDTRWHTAMIVCLAILVRCSHIYMLADWQESRGAKIEHRWAVALHKHIIYQRKHQS